MCKRRIRLCIGVMVLCLFAGCGKSAASCYKAGTAFLKQGNMEQAAEELKKAVEKNPERAEYYLELGNAQVLSGQFAEARESFAGAVVEKDLPLTRKNNKYAYRGIGISCYKEQDYGKAAEYFEKAMAIADETGIEEDLLRYYAKTCRMLLWCDKAEETYTELLKRHPKETGLYMERAKVRLLAGRYAESAGDYQKALELDDSCCEASFGLYEALLKQGEQAQAEAVLLVFSELEQPTGLEQFYIAKADYLLGKPEALDEMLFCAANGFPRAYVYAGELYRLRHAYQDAVTYYTLAEQNGEADALVYYQRAVCLISLGKYSDAVSDAGKAWRQNVEPELKPLLFRTEITALEKLGEYDTAYERVLAFLEAYPEDENAIKEKNFIESRKK